MCSRWRAAAPAFVGLAIALSTTPSPVRADAPPALVVVRFDVPSDCMTREAFVARLEALGASPVEAEVEVVITSSWAGLFAGEVVVRRAGSSDETRNIEDAVCSDVVDALAISAALVLRTAGSPAPEITPERTDDTLAVPSLEAPTPPILAEPTPSGPVVRGSIGVGLRVGLGPTPGVAAAPELSLVLSVDRFVAGVRVLFWPESAAPSDVGAVRPDGSPTPGVALTALGATLELGGRIGDAIAVVPSAVLELGPTFGRGRFVTQPDVQTAFSCDAGVAAQLELELGPVRFFARADLLFAIAQPAYVIVGTVVHEAPIVRGAGAVGLSYVFGP